ncbi:MAG: glycosyltransferase [Microthrixaceae bacterium]|nr:glycosyltransferase [Microthrixaceae bacterium]
MPSDWLGQAFERFAGTPLVLQILFLTVLGIASSTLISLAVLVAASSRHRRARRRERAGEEVGERDFLWVFLVPALNEEVTIADSVSRLLHTECTNRVILVINDGSEDATGEVLAGIASDDLHVLTRVAPQARLGKAAALNQAFAHVRTDILRQERYAGFSPDRVILGVVDADGRIDADAPARVAWHFADERMGGVQLRVRIYNRRGYLTWAQDVEFSAFAYVFQAGRASWGTANMGGNGQFNRLSALASVTEAEGPWRDRLTEDQDLGVRLIQAGWRGSQENLAVVNQQGLNSLRRLLRQRTRWAQGAWQALDLLPGSGRIDARFIARVDAVFYLLTPVLQLLTGLALVATLILAFVYDIPLVPSTLLFTILFLCIGFGPGMVTLLLRGNGWREFGYALLVVIPYTAYSWLVFPALLRGLGRHLVGRRGWAKTAREPLQAAGEPETEVRGPAPR